MGLATTVEPPLYVFVTALTYGVCGRVLFCWWWCIMMLVCCQKPHVFHNSVMFGTHVFCLCVVIPAMSRWLVKNRVRVRQTSVKKSNVPRRRGAMTHRHVPGRDSPGQCGCLMRHNKKYGGLLTCPGQGYHELKSMCVRCIQIVFHYVCVWVGVGRCG